MEKLKTRNEYVGCNRKCRFYGDEIKAVSYDHWTFVAKINGLIVFNDYSYSHTTTGHQWAIRSLLRELGIDIDLEVNMSSSLDEYSFKRYALDSFYDDAISRIVQNNTKRVQKKTKEANKGVLTKLRTDIKELRKAGVEYSASKFYKTYKNYKSNRDYREIFIQETKGLKGKIYRDCKNVRFKVKKVDNKNQCIDLEALEGWRNPSLSYNWFKKDYTMCPLSNALQGE